MKITRSLPVLLPALLMIVIGACSDSATVSEDSGAAVADIASPDTQAVDAGPTLPDAGPAAAPWSKRYGSDPAEQGNAVAVDSAGNVYVTGSFGAAITYTGKQLNLGRHEGGSDLMVMRMDPTLTPVWAASAGGSKADAGTGIAHVGGTLYVTGTIGSGVLLNTQLHNDPYLQPGPVVAGKGGSDVLVARLSTSGLFSWGVAAGGSSDELAGALAMGPGGKLHIAGTLRSTAVFGGTSLNSTAGELFVARLVPGFGFDWAENFDGSTGDAMAVNSLGQIYVTGSFSAPAAFGATTLNKGHTYVLKVARP